MFSFYVAEKPITRFYGRWTNPKFVAYQLSGLYYGDAKYRDWTLDVDLEPVPKVLKALGAKDGYEANMGFNPDASARIYPRFQHKHFSWGEAVSFLVQYQNDNTNCVPNNGMLYYEIHGVTKDQSHTILASFGITHPKLAEFGPKVRSYDDDTMKPNSAMRKDRDYILVETCADEDFQPSIKEIDAMVDTLKFDGKH